MFVIVACMIVALVIVALSLRAVRIMVFQRACGRARGEVVVLNIEGTACGCLCGGQRIAFRRFWRGCLVLVAV